MWCTSSLSTLPSWIKEWGGGTTNNKSAVSFPPFKNQTVNAQEIFFLQQFPLFRCCSDLVWDASLGWQRKLPHQPVHGWQSGHLPLRPGLPPWPRCSGHRSVLGGRELEQRGLDTQMPLSVFFLSSHLIFFPVVHNPVANGSHSVFQPSTAPTSRECCRSTWPTACCTEAWASSALWWCWSAPRASFSAWAIGRFAASPTAPGRAPMTSPRAKVRKPFTLCVCQTVNCGNTIWLAVSKPHAIAVPLQPGVKTVGHCVAETVALFFAATLVLKCCDRHTIKHRPGRQGWECCLNEIMTSKSFSGCDVLDSQQTFIAF